MPFTAGLFYRCLELTSRLASNFDAHFKGASPKDRIFHFKKLDPMGRVTITTLYGLQTREAAREASAQLRTLF